MWRCCSMAWSSRLASMVSEEAPYMANYRHVTNIMQGTMPVCHTLHLTSQEECNTDDHRGIMTVILADEQFTDYYNIDADMQGTVSVIPWATTGLAQLFLGGTLASLVGRVWALRISICVMCIGV